MQSLLYAEHAMPLLTSEREREKERKREKERERERERERETSLWPLSEQVESI